jgi:hypothetical protein
MGRSACTVGRFGFIQRDWLRRHHDAGASRAGLASLSNRSLSQVVTNSQRHLEYRRSTCRRFRAPAGIVTVTGGRSDWRDEVATGPPLPPSVPGRDHQPHRLAIPRIQPRSSGCGADPGGTRCRRLVRDGATLVQEIRSEFCRPTAPASATTRRQVAQWTKSSSGSSACSIISGGPWISMALCLTSSSGPA